MYQTTSLMVLWCFVEPKKVHIKPEIIQCRPWRQLHMIFQGDSCVFEAPVSWAKPEVEMTTV